MHDLAVEARDIVRTFRDGSVRALDGVSLSVERGHIFGLLGPNGSGKTTMVRILSTIIRPDAGTATVNGADVVHQANAVRRSIGLAGQFATVDDNLTGIENLRMIGRLNHLSHDVVRDRSRTLLEEFGLIDAARRNVKTYSGGMRRRLDLAAALVASPPLLFLDEPTTGLDPQSRQDLWAIIEGLAESGTTVLLTTQYLEEADRLADQLAVLDRGRIIAEGTAGELKARLGATVLSLTFPSTEAAQRASTLLTDVATKPLFVEGTVVDLTVDDGPAAAAESLRRVDAAALVVTGLALREPSLDDVFLALTGHHADDEAPEPALTPRGRGPR